MHSVFAAVFVLCIVAAQARVVIEWESDFENQMVSDINDMKDRLADLGRYRYRCRCCPHGCGCSGRYKGVRISGSFMLDETEQGKTEHVAAMLKFGKKEIAKRFEVEKTETVCVEVQGKDICAEFDFHDKDTTDNFLDGCVKFTKPEETKEVCFKLPRITEDSEDEDDASFDQDVEDYFQ